MQDMYTCFVTYVACRVMGVHILHDHGLAAVASVGHRG